jgi:Uma2 family endonuclease
MSASARPLPSPATLADLLALDEETRRRHELLGGELVERGAASGRHGLAQASLTSALVGPFGRRAGGGPPERPGGWIFAVEADVYFDEENTLRPDISAWRRERMPEIPDEFPLRLVPDWACEILSTNKRNDLIRKKRVYHEHRVKHYWILDPAEGIVSVHRWTDAGYLEVVAAERGQRVRAEPFEALELAVGSFFGDDEE